MTYQTEVLADSPRAFWMFDETSGAPVDSSGNGKVATLVGAPTQSATGVTLNGSNQGISTNVTLNDSQFSIEFWYKGTDANGLVASARGPGGYSVSAFIGSSAVGSAQPGQLVIGLNGDGTWQGAATLGVINDDVEHHVVVSWASSAPTANFNTDDVRVTIDGRARLLYDLQYATRQAPISSNGQGYYLGYPAYESNGGYLSGRLRRVAFYGAPLSMDRVRAHWIAGGGTLPSGSPRNAYVSAILRRPLQGFWLQEESAGPLVDQAGQLPFTIAGSPTFLVAGPSADTKAIAWHDSTSEYAGTAVAAQTVRAATFECWVYLTAVPGKNVSLLSTAANANPGTQNSEQGVYLDAAGRVNLYQYNGGQPVAQSTPLSLNTWHQVVAKYDAATGMTIRVDKVTVAQLSAGAIGVGARGLFMHGGFANAGAPVTIALPSYAQHKMSDAETDAAYDALTAAASTGTIALGVATETDTAPSARLNIVVPIGVATETDAAQPLVVDAYPVPAAPTDAYSAVVLTDSPVAYWKLGESGPYALDYSGAKRSGKLTGTYARPAGAVVQNSDGASTDFTEAIFQRVDAALSPQNITVEAWFTADATDGYRPIAGHGMINKTPAWALFILDGSLRYIFSSQSTTGGSVVVSKTIGAITPGTRYHVVIVAEGAPTGYPDPTSFQNMYSYLNAVESQGQTGAGALTNAIDTNLPVTIGASPYRFDAGDSGSIKYFDGRIDEVAIYDHRLTPARVQAHYTAGLPASGSVALGVGAETDTAPPLKVGITLQLGVPVEADSAPAAALKTGVRISLGVAVESDSAPGLVLSSAGVIALHVATEMDAARPLTITRGVVLNLGVATEIDLARPLFVSVGGGAQALQMRVAYETDIASPITIFTSTPGGPSTGVGTTRWIFHDDVTGESWTVPINPINASPLGGGPRRQLRHGNGMRRDRRVRTMVGEPKAVEWSFGGAIRTKEHNDQLARWARKPNLVTITDHLGRQIKVFFTSYEPTDRKPNSYTPWRMRYTMKCYVLEVTP